MNTPPPAVKQSQQSAAAKAVGKGGSHFQNPPSQKHLYSDGHLQEELRPQNLQTETQWHIRSIAITHASTGGKYDTMFYKHFLLSVCLHCARACGSLTWSYVCQHTAARSKKTEHHTSIAN